LLEEEPENVPDEIAKSAPESTKKEPPIENLIGEAVRKATDKVKKELEEDYERRLNEIKAQRSAQDGDYWVQESERLEKLNIIKTPEELRSDAERTVNTVSQIRQMEKERKREIRKQMSTLTAEDKKLFRDDIEDELDYYPDNRPLPPNAVERALIFAKGKNVDKLIADAKKNLEKNVKRIEGEVTGEETFIPEGGSTVTISNKVPTERQKRLAADRGISPERQIWLDEREAKRRKDREKK